MGAHKSNQEQGGKLQAALGGEEQPVPDDEKWDGSGTSTVDEQVADDKPIRKADVLVDTITVYINATLPGTFTGTCYADVELPDGSEHTRYFETLDRTSACSIAIPKEQLEKGSTWNYRLGFYTKDGKTKGSHPERSFEL
jgi:hypothetical protein